MRAYQTMKTWAYLKRSGVAISATNRLRFRLDQVSFGKRCQIAGGGIFVVESNECGEGRLVIGDDVVIGDYANIRATGCVIDIGAGCQLGQFVSMIGADHVVVDGVPQRAAAPSVGISLGAGCWVGTHAVILPNVALGPGSIVGAGAVVTKSWPARSRLVGVPAKPIQSRDAPVAKSS